MKIFKVLAQDLLKSPDKWRYDEFYLWRQGPIHIKISYLCKSPYIILYGKLSLKPTLLDRVRLWWACKKWLKYHSEGVSNALDETMPMDEWVAKREKEMADRKLTCD